MIPLIYIYIWILFKRFLFKEARIIFIYVSIATTVLNFSLIIKVAKKERKKTQEKIKKY